MQIKRSATVGCDTSFRCRSIWKNLPVTGSSGKRGNYIYEKILSHRKTLSRDYEEKSVNKILL